VYFVAPEPARDVVLADRLGDDHYPVFHVAASPTISNLLTHRLIGIRKPRAPPNNGLKQTRTSLRSTRAA
jgi:hypothetical protein